LLSASSAIPVLLAPVLINNIPYADGGMSNNLPIEPFNLKSEKIIASHVNPIPEYDENLNMIQNMDRSIHIIMRNNILNAIDKCDVFIEPPALKKYHLFESKVAKELIDIGYSYSKNEIDLSILNKN
jgi:NTE family protein